MPWPAVGRSIRVVRRLGAGLGRVGEGSARTRGRPFDVDASDRRVGPTDDDPARWRSRRRGGRTRRSRRRRSRCERSPRRPRSASVTAPFEVLDGRRPRRPRSCHGAVRGPQVEGRPGRHLDDRARRAVARRRGVRLVDRPQEDRAVGVRVERRRWIFARSASASGVRAARRRSWSTVATTRPGSPARTAIGPLNISTRTVDGGRVGGDRRARASARRSRSRRAATTSAQPADGDSGEQQDGEDGERAAGGGA